MTSGDRSSSTRSMTGFARVVGSAGDVDIEVEARSVNSRFLEVNLKGPRWVMGVEREARAIFQKLHRRGRVDVVVARRVLRGERTRAAINTDELDGLVSAYSDACKRYGVRGDSLGAFIGSVVLREAFSAEESEALSEQETKVLVGLLEKASISLAVTRETEGLALVGDISLRVSRLEQIRRDIGERMEGASQRVRDRLMERISLITPEVRVDPERLALEVALIAERSDVSEELSRLEIHIQQFLKTSSGHPDGVGRKLDFLTQEIGRELNTIGSKVQDALVQGLVVDGKAELERVREQVQNIE